MFADCASSLVAGCAFDSNTHTQQTGPDRTLEIDGKLYDCASLQSAFKYGGMTPPDGHIMKDGTVYKGNDKDKEGGSGSGSGSTAVKEVEMQAVYPKNDDEEEKPKE